MFTLPLTLVSSCYLPVHAGSQTRGRSCFTLNNRLDIGTYQFYSDCDARNYCSEQGIGEPKGCRRDQYPFGYGPSDDLPPRCPAGQFCPDEGDTCQPLLPVGSTCQLNRDSTRPVPVVSHVCPTDRPPGPMRASTQLGVNVNGAVCLNNVCMWANLTVGEPCQVENTAYIVYTSTSKFINVVSRQSARSSRCSWIIDHWGNGNFRMGLYCDPQDSVYMQGKLLSESCTADKECASFNCNSGGVCDRSIDIPNEFGVLAGISIFGGMFGTLFA